MYLYIFDLSLNFRWLELRSNFICVLMFVSLCVVIVWFECLLIVFCGVCRYGEVGVSWGEEVD